MKHRISHPRLRRVLALAAVLALIVAACGDDDTDALTSTTTAPSITALTTTTAATTTSAAATTTQATTTTAAETTTTAAETTTTAAATTTTTQATTTTIDTNTLASGSGCTPGTDDLPDGEWFGYIDSASADELVFDLACWFTGDAAILASAEDGEESPPPNDYYVRNANEQLRTVPVASDPAVSWLPNVGDPATEESIAYADWLTGRETRGLDLQPGVWLTVENGEIVELREQYVP